MATGQNNQNPAGKAGPSAYDIAFRKIRDRIEKKIGKEEDNYHKSIRFVTSNEDYDPGPKHPFENTKPAYKIIPKELNPFRHPPTEPASKDEELLVKRMQEAEKEYARKHLPYQSPYVPTPFVQKPGKPIDTDKLDDDDDMKVKTYVPEFLKHLKLADVMMLSRLHSDSRVGFGNMFGEPIDKTKKYDKLLIPLVAEPTGKIETEAEVKQAVRDTVIDVVIRATKMYEIDKRNEKWALDQAKEREEEAEAIKKEQLEEVEGSKAVEETVSNLISRVCEAENTSILKERIQAADARKRELVARALENRKKKEVISKVTESVSAVRTTVVDEQPQEVVVDGIDVAEFSPPPKEPETLIVKKMETAEPRKVKISKRQGKRQKKKEAVLKKNDSVVPAKAPLVEVGPLSPGVIEINIEDEELAADNAGIESAVQATLADLLSRVAIESATAASTASESPDALKETIPAPEKARKLRPRVNMTHMVEENCDKSYKSVFTYMLTKGIIKSAMQTLASNQAHTKAIENVFEVIMANVADYLFQTSTVESYYELLQSESESLFLKIWTKHFLETNFEKMTMAHLCPDLVEDDLNVLMEEMTNNHLKKLKNQQLDAVVEETVSVEVYYQEAERLAHFYSIQEADQLQNVDGNDVLFAALLMMCPSREKIHQYASKSKNDYILFECMDQILKLMELTEFSPMLFVKDKVFLDRLVPCYTDILSKKVRIFNKMTHLSKTMIIDQVNDSSCLFLSKFDSTTLDFELAKIFVKSLTTEFIIFGDLVRPRILEF